MTDNEIVKAIEKCASIGESCEDCPFYEYTDCDKRLKECFHDMLNRQKAEIERLQIRNKTLTEITKNYDWKFEKSKSEAIKEFAERLKKVGTKVEGRKGFEGVFIMANNLQIDNLVKEMVGD